MGWLFGGVELRPRWKRYGGACALTLLVIAARLALNPWWGRQHNRHLVFLPTVMIVVGLGGLGPGLLSTVMATAALGIFWMDAGQGLLVNADLLLFFLTGVAICVLVESLRVARNRAEAARRSREQVMAVVAHDLRNPLTSIMMLSSTLQRSGAPRGPDAAVRQLKAIDRAAARMNDLIRDLVDASRIEHGELALSLEPHSVGAIVDETIELHAPLAQERGVALEAQSDDREIRIACDRHRLLQVLANLLGNALKVTGPGGRITLRSRREERGVRFTVDDTGIGIQPEQLPHLFERYWSGQAGGVGLGLYIARSIVEGHEGSLEVRSQPGQGASFSFAIPYPPAALPARRAAPGASRRRSRFGRLLHALDGASARRDR